MLIAGLRELYLRDGNAITMAVFATFVYFESPTKGGTPKRVIFYPAPGYDVGRRQAGEGAL